MITANYVYEGAFEPTLQQRKRMYRQVEASMSIDGGHVNSRSGFAAALAINYCQVRCLPYSVLARPGFGYYVKRERLG